MKWTLAVVISAIAALAIVHFTAPRPQRHHIYFCIYPGNGLPPPYSQPRTGMALPCMYRKNDPVDV
jgi:hypothetical protein